MNRQSFRNRVKLEWFGRAFCTALTAATITSGTAMGEEADLRLASIEPTVFFIMEKSTLLQMVQVSIENTAEPVEVSVEVRLDSKKRATALGMVKKGTASFEVYVPEIAEARPVEFVLKANGKVQDRQETIWRRGRHWKVYMVPITHHDLGYTDTIENVLHQYDGFYDDILRFCDETEDWPEEAKYRFTVDGTWSIQHFIENRPEEDIEKLAQYIREGRIEVGAFFGNEITGMCSHEELIRMMYPSFRLKRRYGAPIRTASITDIPGVSWGVPTVLAGAGAKYFFAGMPTYFEWGRSDIHTFWDESAILRHGRPDAFRWQGPDGETVLVYYQGSYGFFHGPLPRDATGPHSYEEVIDNLPRMLNAMEKQGTPFSVARYIHNGVDNYPPDVKISHIVRQWNSKWAYPQLIVATHTMFFEELEKECQDVRTFKGELPHTDYSVGAISTAKETGINRMTRDRLHSGEKFATIASLVGSYSYPAEDIRRTYDDVLFYDLHCWGMAYPAGEVQDWNWNEKSHYAYRAAGTAERMLSQSLDRIAEKIALEKQGRHIVVFNSLAFERTDVVRVPRFTVEGRPDLIDEETGRKVPYQIVELDSPQAPVPYAANRYGRGQFSRQELFDMVFVAEDVPSLGYKTYRLSPGNEATSLSSSVVVGDNSLENVFFKVSLNPESGAVESIYDKELSRELVDREAPHKLNQFIAKWVKTGEQESPKKAKIRKGQNGPIYGSLVAFSEGAGCPQLTQEVILYDQIKRIDFANRVLKDSTPLLEVYFAFPFLIDNPDFRFEGSNSVIKPLRDQFPGSNSNYYAVQHWADVTDGEMGVTFSSVESHMLEFGGLWPCYVSQAHHGVTPPDFGREFVKPGELTKGYMYSFVLDSNFRTNFETVQQADLLFRYSMTAHRGGWVEGRPRDFGWAIGNPLIAVSVNGKREGTLDKKMSFCSVDKPNVFLLTLKQAEDGEGIIIRLIETEGKDVEATVRLPHLTIEKAYRANLAEENQAKLNNTVHEVTVPIRGFGIATIRLQTP